MEAVTEALDNGSTVTVRWLATQGGSDVKKERAARGVQEAACGGVCQLYCERGAREELYWVLSGPGEQRR